MQLKTVTLHGGPVDGQQSMCSHQTAVVDGEVYVHDGSENEGRFVHAATEIRKLPPLQLREEKDRVEKWVHDPGDPFFDHSGKFIANLPRPMAELIGIPPWRINAWIQLLQNGTEISTHEP